ncbi:MAG: c-type cytochrome [Gammaproteobacteria bacterium]|nr:c-type cytochrome [Gammaproteobacteria bacterium]MBU6508999.1 c-type cytochrome [Gammaproteobacteria bacterium]MDE1983802.1 c-type cytochrome [Gammaproteobacteria bacterium]MDE2108303.1 c-type cytochrome [Gammaproteobacteria bacterium]
MSSTSHATPAPASAQACAACHGAQGQGGGIFPRIAGQPVEFLQNELRFFRSGARPNPMMQPVTKNLSDADIAALAGYFSTLHPPFTPAHVDLSAVERERGQELVTAGDWQHQVPACTSCHGPDLGGTAPLIPALAGQSRQYMSIGLRNMQSLHGQARYFPLQIMSHVVAGLSDTDITAVTGYIASLQKNEKPTVMRPAHDGAYKFTAQSPNNFTPPPESAIPTGPDGDEIWRGRMIFENTRQYAAQYVGDKLNCSSCHLDNGRRADSAPMWAAYVAYPKYRSKNHRVNTLEERIQDCFRFSMNGKPPSADSPVMVALVEYFRWLATGLPVGITPKGAGYPPLPAPPQPPDLQRGSAIYAANCAMCHGSNGEGRGARGTQVFPPLWGPESFNRGAGMQRLSTAAAFIKANMPYGAAGLLSDQQVWDVAAFVVSHPRPPDPRLHGGPTTAH